MTLTTTVTGRGQTLTRWALVGECSTLAPRGRERLVSCVVGDALVGLPGSRNQQLKLSSGEPVSDCLGARVLDGRPASAGCGHGPTLAATRKLPSPLGRTSISGYSNDMTSTGTATRAARLGKCVRCAKLFRSTAPVKATYFGLCDVCEIDGWKPAIKWTKISGRVTETECDDACKSAKGTKCACSCGGERHGEAWGL
jgi:hypothetical protein